MPKTCRRRSASLPVLLCLVLVLSGCRPTTTTLTVSAASDLTYAFQEIAARFQAETGHRVVFNFGSSGQLAQQIELGAPVDLFASADMRYVAELAEKGLVLADTVQVYARGQLVLWTRGDSPLALERLEDLGRPEVRRFAIANPDHAPYGIAAREALQAAGLWEALQPKLVLAENVRQALQYAETGNVDAAIVALSLSLPAAAGPTDPGRWVLVPSALYTPIDQALAVVKGTQHEAAARAFVAYVNSPPGQEVLRKYGFYLP